MRKQHNTTDTSIEAHRERMNNGQVLKDKATVLKALAGNQPCKSRRLEEITGIERCSIAGTINWLEHKDKQIKVAFKRKCPTSGRRVGFYTLNNWIEVD